MNVPDSEFYKKKKRKEQEIYGSWDVAEYKESLVKPLELWEMDEVNAGLGVTKKIWWEKITGRLLGKRILDVGCGNAYHVPYFSLIRSNEVIGLDASKESLDILGKFLGELELEAKLVNGVAEELLVEGTFDVINFSNMLHHVENPRACLRNAFKKLRPGGYLIVCEPIYYFPFRWIVETEIFGRVNFLKKHFMSKELTFEEEQALPACKYIKAVEKANFRIIHLDYDKNFFGYAANLLGLKNKPVRFLVFVFDKFFTLFVPKTFRSFVYIVATK